MTFSRRSLLARTVFLGSQDAKPTKPRSRPQPQNTNPITPDGRYFLVRGILWRCSNPSLPEARRQALTDDLMRARRLVGEAKRHQDKTLERAARSAVDEAKVALGERGPVWWTDGARFQPSSGGEDAIRGVG